MKLTEDEIVNIVYLINKEIIDLEQKLWYTEHTEIVKKYLVDRLIEMNNLKKSVLKFL